MRAADPDLHVTFVCTGNICRSPIARIVYQRALDEAGLTGRVRVTSAGTGGWHEGDPADSRARRVLERHGYPTEHTAAEIDADHLSADLVIALDTSHMRELLARGVDPARVVLLRSFDPDSPAQDVPDPYYGDLDDFETTLRQVEDSIPGLIDWTRDRVG